MNGALESPVGRVAFIGTDDYRGKGRFQTVNDEPSLTVQSDAPEADITNILRQYKEVGIMSHLRQTEITYMDISEFEDFADAQRQLKIVEVEFMKLPSKVRGIFGHDAANWLDAAMDKEKRNALVEAGWVEAPEAAKVEPPAEVPKAPVVPPLESVGG